MLELCFWTAIGLVVYAYVGYPALLALFGGRARKREPLDDAALPTVTMIVAAHNEEAVIGRKILNTLRHDYPADKLDVLVVSDGSTDATEANVMKRCGSRVRLAVQTPQRGKNDALNLGVRHARGEIVAFTDANAMMAKGSLRALVAPFADESTGLVSGRGLYGTLDENTPRAVSNAYVRYETFIKEREASMGFLAAADGALYAIRRELHRELRWNQVHDLMHPILATLLGKRSDFVPDAYTIEPPSKDAAAEFRRHVRIIAQGFLVYVGQAPFLAEQGKWKELCLLTSHRPLRWLSGVFLAAAFASSLALALGSTFYLVLVLLQIAFYAAALGGALGERVNVKLRLLAIPYYFCVVSAAGFSGLMQVLRGHSHVSWASSGGS